MTGPRALARTLLGHLLKVAPWVAAGVLLAAALVERVTIVRVTAERDRLVTVVTDATVPADARGDRKALTPDQALAAAAGLARDRDDARASLARVDADARASKARSDVADRALARTQTVNRREFAQAAPRIAALAAAKPAGDPDADAAAIERDSKAAWEGWR